MKTLLKNGTIVDGSGGKPYVSDVLIENDKITKIAKDIDAADAEVIDCTGLTVAPGFIDAHSHNEFTTTTTRKGFTSRLSVRESPPRSRATADFRRSASTRTQNIRTKSAAVYSTPKTQAVSKTLLKMPKANFTSISSPLSDTARRA